MEEQTNMVTPGIPWPELLSSGGVGVALAMCWLFLKHLRETRQADLEESQRKDAAITHTTTQFSETIRAVSADVKDGMDKMQQTQIILLKDNREREAQLHTLLRDSHPNINTST